VVPNTLIGRKSLTASRLEQYSWRDQEKELNTSLSQFRTAFQVPGSEAPVRVHFIHARSPHANAVPLLLIPPFPLTNLSLGRLITPLSDPEDAGTTQPFHVVIPSLPGIGFSDALPKNTSPISTTATILDALMKRLDYQHYIVTNAGPSATLPAEIDWKLVKHLSNHYSESCLGAHFISPPLSAPTLQESPVEWAKWTIANFTRSPMLGYSKDDFSAMQRARNTQTGPAKAIYYADGISEGEWEPNTMAYALCDSPTGLLLHVLKLLRIMNPRGELTPTEIITLAELIWLPGPEAALRFWAQCSSHVENDAVKKAAAKPKISLTVFLGDDEQESDEDNEKVLPRPARHTYACPAWAHARYNVVHSNRVSGSPGFLAWDRPEVIFDGVRGLAKAVLATDKRMQASELPGVALLEQIVVGGNNTAQADLSGTTVQDTPEASDAKAKDKGKQIESPGQKSDTTFLAPPTDPHRKASATSAGSTQQASP
jgi:hypothetical protein